MNRPGTGFLAGTETGSELSGTKMYINKKWSEIDGTGTGIVKKTRIIWNQDRDHSRFLILNTLEHEKKASNYLWSWLYI